MAAICVGSAEPERRNRTVERICREAHRDSRGEREVDDCLFGSPPNNDTATRTQFLGNADWTRTWN